MKVCRKESFNAAHRLHNPNLSEKENKQLFGVCNNPNYHGHNYTLICCVEGEINPITGYVMDLKILSELIENEVLNRFDHKNLNLDCAEFFNLNPTAENIAKVIYSILRKQINTKLTLEITLWETDRNYVIYNGKY
ncbi:MAG: 6-carboxytetrahydropterin synthase [Flavobacteriia bacterium]|nr:6-carboxytetrahydropterin synthase [Flavobacteriia bacterium]